jgi:hypothetical protein
MQNWNRLRVLGIAVCLSSLGAIPAAAQASANEPTYYALVDGSTYQHGCFDPCMCPLMETAPLKGSFVLTFAGSDGLFDLYDVSEVDWTAIIGNEFERSIQGSGTYRVGGEFAVMHELSLDLKIDGEPPTRLSSGLVVGGGDFPAIVTTISIHGGFCLDTVIQVVAKPTTKLSIAHDAISWQASPMAAGYDVVAGDLGLLRQTQGDFEIAAQSCLANDAAASQLPHAVIPGPGTAMWMLVRPGAGSWDSGCATQLGSRDAGIAASPGACP